MNQRSRSAASMAEIPDIRTHDDTNLTAWVIDMQVHDHSCHETSMANESSHTGV